MEPLTRSKPSNITTMSITTRPDARWLAFAIVTVFLVVAMPRPALGCSCAWPPDMATWIDEAPGAFVGSLTEVRPSAAGPFGGEAVFVFEVDQWVKGGPSDFVEVHAHIGDGANCGLGTEIGVQMGVLLHWSEGRLTSSSCSSFSPEMILSAGGLIPDSESKLPWLLVSGSSTFKVLDNTGRLVTALDSRRSAGEWGQAQRSHLDVCPGGEHFVHRTQSTLAIWDNKTLELVDQVDLAQYAEVWSSAVSCRDQDASEVWLGMQGEGESTVIDVRSGATLFTVSGSISGIGTTHLTIESERGPVSRLDFTTGETVTLFEKPDGVEGYPVARPNPVDGTSVVVFSPSDFEGQGKSRLLVFDADGMPRLESEFGPETYLVGWVNQYTIAVIESRFGSQDLHFVDAREGGIVTIPGLGVWELVSDGSSVISMANGEIQRIDIATGALEWVASVDDPMATAVMLLEGSDIVTQPRTVNTQPPLTPAELGVANLGSATRTARITLIMLGVGALIAWVVLRMRPKPGAEVVQTPDSPPD